MPSLAEKQILVAPDVVARAAAAMAPDTRQRWMLKQPRAVRRSYADMVLGRPDEERLAEAWMLLQPRDVRRSYLDEVVSEDADAPRELIWMLSQDDATCRSYARFVLLEDDGVLGF